MAPAQFSESSKAYLSVSFDNRSVQNDSGFSGLVGEFTEGVAFPSGMEWVAYSGGLKTSAPVYSLCEEYCATPNVNLIH